MCTFHLFHFPFPPMVNYELVNKFLILRVNQQSKQFRPSIKTNKIIEEFAYFLFS